MKAPQSKIFPVIRRILVSSALVIVGLPLSGYCAFSNRLAAQTILPKPTSTLRSAPSGSDLMVLEQISHASQAFYKGLENSLVTVELDPNPLHMLPKKLQHSFLVWEKKWVVQHDFRDNLNARRGEPPEPQIIIKPNLRTGKGLTKTPVLDRRQKEHLRRINQRAPVELFLIRHFLFKTHPLPPREFWPEIQLINARINSNVHHGAATVRGLIVGPRGCIVVPSMIAPPDDLRPITVVNARGKKLQGHILGVNTALGVTVLALNPDAKIHGLPLARHRIHPAALLFAVDVTASSAHWVMPLGPHRGPHSHPRRPGQDGRFGFGGVMGTQPAFVFNLRGHLAALNIAHGFFPLNNNRYGLRTFILTGLLQPPRFGIQYAMIPLRDPLRKHITGLDHKAAMRVIGTFPHSPAARAGVKKGDIIIAIDGISVINFREIHRHIMANPQDVELTILRHGQTRHIKMTLRHGLSHAAEHPH
ncbi:MAG: PDZ domain-containing protein [Phycisphaerae bacterium]